MTTAGRNRVKKQMLTKAQRAAESCGEFLFEKGTICNVVKSNFHISMKKISSLHCAQSEVK